MFSDDLKERLALINRVYISPEESDSTESVEVRFLTEDQTHNMLKQIEAKYTVKNKLDRSNKKFQLELSEFEIRSWLNRIIRYFMVSFEIRDKNSKKNTAHQITEFLDDMQKFPQEIVNELITNTDALRCIIFSLMLSRDTTQWKKIQLIIGKQLPESSPLLKLLDWYFVTFVAEDLNASVAFAKEAFELLEESPRQSAPVTNLFYFISDIEYICRLKLLDETPPDENAHLTENIPPQKITNLFLDSIAMCAYTLNHHYLEKIQKKMTSLFTRMIVEAPLELLPLGNETFRYATGKAFYVLAIEDLQTKDKKNTTDKKNAAMLHYLSIMYTANELHLERPLIALTAEIATEAFKQGDYASAANLYVWTQNAQSDNLYPLQMMVMILCWKMDTWLIGKSLSPGFGSSEQKLITTHLKADICSELAPFYQEHITSIGKRILERYKKASDSDKSKCEPQFKLIVDILGEKRARALVSEFKNIKIEVQQKKTPQQKPLNDLSFFETKATKKKTGNKPIPPKTIIEEPVSKPLTKKTTTTKNSNTVPTVTVKPAPMVKTSTPLLFISRSTLPESLFQCLKLVNTLTSDCVAVLTGGAVASYIEKKTTREIHDLDITIFVPEKKLELVNPDTVKTLFEKQHPDIKLCRIQSKKHPIIYCEFSNGLQMDFSLVYQKSNQTFEECLVEDSLKRDFNIAALNIQLDASKDKLPVKCLTTQLPEDFPRLISIINKQGDKLFESDPRRVLRLAHLLIQYQSKYAMDNTLEQLKLAMKGTWMNLFLHYMKQSSANTSQIHHAMDKLVKRHHYADIIDAFDKLELLHTFIQRKKKDLLQAVSYIPSDLSPMYRCLAFVMACTVTPVLNMKKHQIAPCHVLFSWSESAQPWIDFLSNKTKCPDAPKDMVQLYEKLKTQGQDNCYAPLGMK